MDQDTSTTRRPKATRRSFLKSGALLAAPLAAVPAMALAGNRTNDAAVARLQGDAAIRDLHQAWLRRIDSGFSDPLLGQTIRRITADPAGAADRIELAADGRNATGQFDCLVDFQTPLPLDCTLAQMAHAQGHGAMCHTERRRLRVDYALGSGGWQIEHVAFAG